MIFVDCSLEKTEDVPVNITSLSFPPVFTKYDFVFPSTVLLIFSVSENPPPPCLEIVEVLASNDRALRMAGSILGAMFECTKVTALHCWLRFSNAI
jgi:hypothetical protein